MKTHQFATALETLANILRVGPNIELNDFKNQVSNAKSADLFASSKNAKEDIPLALNALLSLSNIDKQAWKGVISDMGFDIEVRTRDSSYDMLSKVLRYLQSNPQARSLLLTRVKAKTTQASPELARALSSLLNG